MAVLFGSDPWAGRTLARVPLSGGAPREVLENVFEAAWGPDGVSLLVVRQPGAGTQIEFPIGRVLYQSDAFITWARVSPKGDQVAFFEHPVNGDLRGDVVMVDLAGRKTTLSAGWEDLGGLAWPPDAKEVWFTATDSGSDRMLYAVTLTGRKRLVETVPGHLVLQDISRRGDVLLSHGTRRPVILGFAAGAAKETDLSWLDYPVLADLSADGKKVLFSEQGVGGGAGYSVYLRAMDHSPAVRLGKGFAQSLSPDGKWALTIQLGPSPQIVVLPAGAGEPRALAPGPLQGFHWAGFFPDGNRILITGYEAGKGRRLYVQDLAGGAPRAIAPEGVGTGSNTISPDGTTVAAFSGRTAALYPVGGGEPRPIAGLQPNDLPLRWDASGRVLYVRAAGPGAARVFRLDVVSGRREPWKELAPADLAGVGNIVYVRLTADGSSYAYTYPRNLSNLYLVRGLK